MKKLKVIAIGETVWDMLPAGKQLGGAPLNFAFFAKELGADAYAVSAIGNDSLGDETFGVASATGVNLDRLQRNDLPTSRVLVTLDEKVGGLGSDSQFLQFLLKLLHFVPDA